MIQAGYAQVNHIAEEIHTKIKASNNQLVNAVTTMGNKDSEYMTANSAAMNATLENSLPTQIAGMFKKMQTQLTQMEQRVNVSTSNSHKSRNGGKNKDTGGTNKKRKTLDNPSFICRTTLKYCWRMVDAHILARIARQI